MVAQNKTTKLVILISSLLALGSIIALVFSVALTNRMQNKVAERQLELLAESTDSKNKLLFKELESTLITISKMVSAGAFSNHDFQSWNAKLGAFLQSNLYVESISLIDDSGSEFWVSLESAQFNYYHFTNHEDSVAQFFLSDLNNENTTFLDTTISYRALSLDSYKKHKAHNPDTVVWYEAQTMPGINNIVGSAASIKTSDKSNIEYIITIYVSLKTIYNYLKSNKVVANSGFFLFTENREAFDLKEAATNASAELALSGYLIPWEKINNQIAKSAIFVWEEAHADDSIQYLPFKYKNNKYWGAFLPIQNNNEKLWYALIINADSISMDSESRIGFLFIGSIAVLLISTITLIIVLRKFQSSDNYVNSFTNYDILKMIENGEDEYVEFKSTVRMNLFIHKVGKEIELAWLKSVVAFCNTKGGTILIGVNDEGKILGLESDKFLNDDKCLLHIQNLLKDHIGMEFSRYVNYKIFAINGKKMITVHCNSAPKPLFLISNGKEQYFVRSGPASIELPISKALTYIEDRKK